MIQTEPSENFDKAPPEKRQAVINAGLACFARDGYKKTAMSEIAAMAGVSKPSLFHYFGTKAGLYCFLLRHVIRVTADEMARAKPALAATEDYFERYMLSAEIKLALMKENRAIMDFSVSMYQEQAPEVRPAIEAALAETFALRDTLLLGGVDASKFKDPADAGKLDTMIRWLAQGCMDDWKQGDAQEEIVSLFYECFGALKRHYYKEAY